MILRSEAVRRRPAERGFTFLEVLLSLAMTALVMMTVMMTFSRAATLQAERLRSLWLAEFAVSALEEYKVTYPEMAQSGGTADGWQWQIEEDLVSPNPPGSLDGEMTYVAISATVWRKDRPDQTHAATTLVARRN
jgi:type II secretory pathway pseudopilin PulG